MAQEQLIRRIVVGVDGSDQARAALQWSADMASATGAEVVAVFAIDVSTSYYAFEAIPIPQYDPVWREAIQSEFEETWCEPLRRGGVHYRTIVAEGRPAKVLSEVAEDVDADLVVVGRRGRGGVAELVLGSVSHDLSHRCKRPVLLISHAKVAARAA